MEREEYRKKIKEAIKQAYKDDPCHNCGPGNGCDDCRGCKDVEISRQIWKHIHEMEDDYKKKFGVSYEFDNDLAIVKEIEKNWQKWSKYCRTCGGNFGDDCIDCKDFDEITKCANSFQFKKNELKRKYNYDYDKNKIETKKSKSTTEIITAEQANKLLAKEIEDDNKYLIPIMESIKNAIKQKRNYTYINGGIPDYVIDKLKNLGYKVQSGKTSSEDPKEIYMYEIKW